MSHSATRVSRIVQQYRQYLDSSDLMPLFQTIHENYTVGTLGTLLEHGSQEARRAAALALSVVGDRRVTELLGRHLSDPDRGVRLMADDAFRAILIRDAPPAHHQTLLHIMHLNDGAEFAAALIPAMMLVQQAPRYAEAYHQLAVAWFGLDDFESAQIAYSHCLWLCRYHYLAWSGLADCRLAAGDYEDALRLLDRAIDIAPDFEAARIEARAIRRTLDEDPPQL